MNRNEIINTIGQDYYTTNVERGEFSYLKAVGGMANLRQFLGRKPAHYRLDLRFNKDGVSVLVETKQNFTREDEKQLREYVWLEQTLYPKNKRIAILANTNDNKIKVWEGYVDDASLIVDEDCLDSIDHYCSLFGKKVQNNREKVMHNTKKLNELLHKKDIDERLRSQFVGTIMLFIKFALFNELEDRDDLYDDAVRATNRTKLAAAKNVGIIAQIDECLKNQLEHSRNKEKKLELLRKNVLEDQKVKRLSTKDWIELIDFIEYEIYRYINQDTSEGQDILNLFFITFNKYTGKADKNQAFTPDHITDFMCRVVGINRNTRVLDATCGSGSFLVQAMVQELSDCKRGTTEQEQKELENKVRTDHIFGIEIDETAYGLATTNMLIHGDGNSNIEFKSCFECEEFIAESDPDVILMNPPYNAKPRTIPGVYKENWDRKAREGKSDPTKGLVFIHYLSDVISHMNKNRLDNGESPKYVKLAVLLPLPAAIGNSDVLRNEKSSLLENNTLEAVFTLPQEIFYPGAAVTACCMIFNLGEPHVKHDGFVKETFFGYYKDDGFVKRKGLGRVEQFDINGDSVWKKKKEEWLDLYRNKKVVDGKSCLQVVAAEDEWLCEAYMKTDYSTIKEEDFQQTVNDYLAYLVRSGVVFED